MPGDLLVKRGKLDRRGFDRTLRVRGEVLIADAVRTRVGAPGANMANGQLRSTLQHFCRSNLLAA